LMDHLKIPKAHLHGYSMGGGIVGRLMAMIPDRIITAGFGGSGSRWTSIFGWLSVSLGCSPERMIDERGAISPVCTI